MFCAFIANGRDDIKTLFVREKERERERVAAVLRENRRRGGRASGARTGDS